MSCPADSLVTLACRYGQVTVPPHDTVVGRSLAVYGEWAQNEIDTLRSLIPEGGVVIDAGAYLGTHALALADHVGATGKVFALEPQPQIFELLLRNLKQNQVRNVEARNCAAAAKRQLLPFPRLDLCTQQNFANTMVLDRIETSQQALLVPAITLDEIESARLDLIKVDAEGMEPQILDGATATLARHRPLLYVECRSVSAGMDLFDRLTRHSYRVFLHRPSAFNPRNFRDASERIFGVARETNLLAIAGEAVERYESQLAENPDLLPVDDPDELARRLLDTPRWGDPEWETLPQVELVARMTQLLEDQQLLHREKDDERRRRRTAEQRQASLLSEVERERQSVKRQEERIAELEGANAATQLAAREEARSRLREVAVSVELRKRLAALQVEVDELRFEATWKPRIARAEEHRLQQDLVRIAGSLQGSPGFAAASLQESVLQAVRDLFDEAFYRQANPDIEPGPEGAFDHFLRLGGRLGRDPHRLFDSSFYLERNADVRAAGSNPLAHFVLSGAREGRDPHPLFDVDCYVRQLPTDVTEQPGFNPLLHFLREGARRGLDPHPLFSTNFYLEQVPEIRGTGTDPLSHYIAEGAWRGCDPHPLFDSSYSLARYPQPRLAAMDPLSRYVLYGAAAGEDPHPFLSSAPHGNDGSVLHFERAGARIGLKPRRAFNLTLDQKILAEYDQLRQDGLPVLLLVSHMGGGGTEKHVEELAAVLRGRCHVFLVRPANHHLLGPAAAGRLALSPLGREMPGLLFDPAEQLADLVTVLRGLGVERVHVHQLRGNQGYLRELLIALGLPFDVSVHDYRLLSPRFSQRDHPQAFPGDESEDMSPVADGGATGAIAEWRRCHGWLITEAERVLAPSADAARRIARAFPSARCLAVAHPELPPFDPQRVEPPWLRADEPLRVLLIGELLPHKGEAVVRDTCRRLAERREPVELHLVGFLASGVAIEGLRDHGRYRDAGLGSLIESVSPHLAWFPAQWPETYSYTLSAALRAALPVIVSDLGALPERVGGRSWSWVRPWTSTPDAWCDAFLEVRACLLERCAPEPPPALDVAHRSFYPEGYLKGWRTE